MDTLKVTVEKRLILTPLTEILHTKSCATGSNWDSTANICMNLTQKKDCRGQQWDRYNQVSWASHFNITAWRSRFHHTHQVMWFKDLAQAFQVTNIWHINLTCKPQGFAHHLCAIGTSCLIRWTKYMPNDLLKDSVTRESIQASKKLNRKKHFLVAKLGIASFYRPLSSVMQGYQ